VTIFSRRQLLHGAASVAGLAAFPGLAAPAGQLRNGEILPNPDFALLREANPYVIGVRPHRKGGVNLKLEEQPLESPSGKKYLIHNYGHGGGGITLSWGCASIVTDFVETVTATLGKTAPSVAILGTGVIGLTAATELRRRWPALPMTVYAADLDLKTTTSFIAGGQFEPSGIFKEYEGEEPKKVLAAILRKSRDRIVQLQSSGQRTLFGVAERKNYTLDHENKAFDQFTPFDVVPEHRKGKLPFDKLKGPGREYSTWLLNPVILLPKLASDLAEASVKFKQQLFATKEEVLALPENIVINCTGLGAKKLFGDQNLIAQRGHLVVLQKTDPKQFYFFSGGCANKVTSYVFCRQDDIVVGGTVQPGQDSALAGAQDEAVFQRILSNSREVFGGNVKACAV
jgi:D-amino-acid oxidase